MASNRQLPPLDTTHDDRIHFLPVHERTPLLNRRLTLTPDQESLSAWTKESHAIASTAVGERLPYANYTTIDWLHDLVRAFSARGEFEFGLIDG